MTNNNQKQIAMYIDLENVVCSWNDEVAKMNPEVKIAVPFDNLIERYRNRGRLAVVRAYANWSIPKFGSVSPTMRRLGVEMVHVDTGHKNATDIRLTIDATRDLVVMEAVDEVIIVSGDGDFQPLAYAIRSSGRRVSGCGVPSCTSSSWTTACDEFDLTSLAVPSVRFLEPNRPSHAQSRATIRPSAKPKASSGPVFAQETRAVPIARDFVEPTSTPSSAPTIAPTVVGEPSAAASPAVAGPVRESSVSVTSTGRSAKAVTNAHRPKPQPITDPILKVLRGANLVLRIPSLTGAGVDAMLHATTQGVRRWDEFASHISADSRFESYAGLGLSPLKSLLTAAQIGVVSEGEVAIHVLDRPTIWEMMINACLTRLPAETPRESIEELVGCRELFVGHIEGTVAAAAVVDSKVSEVPASMACEEVPESLHLDLIHSADTTNEAPATPGEVASWEDEIIPEMSEAVDNDFPTADVDLDSMFDYEINESEIWGDLKLDLVPASTPSAYLEGW
jgi:uncharacterized LabA/DUF88 family protein